MREHGALLDKLTENNLGVEVPVESGAPRGIDGIEVILGHLDFRLLVTQNGRKRLSTTHRLLSEQCQPESRRGLCLAI
jgi:hypothetical protein